MDDWEKNAMAQYLHLFVIYQYTCELNLVLLSQNAQWFCKLHYDDIRNFCFNNVVFCPGCFMVNFAIVDGCTWSFGILLPEISERFNASATQVAWLPATASFIRFIRYAVIDIGVSKLT